ncbi:MAG: hypothetical protein Q9174_001256 [Haloplaca sp. 1 TL-2023]
MAQGLPEGFMQTSEHLKGNIESVEHVEVEDIARLTAYIRSGTKIDHHARTAYHTNRAILADDVGRRLEHFFWRLWGSDRLLATISGNLVAAIFSKISEGGYIRTTPTQSPRSSRSLGVAHPLPRLQRHHESRQGSLTQPGTGTVDQFGNGNHDDGVEQTMTEPISVDRRKLPPRPPPILKKTSSTSPSDPLKDTYDPTQLAQGPTITTGRETFSANHPTSIATPRLSTEAGNAIPRIEKTTRFQTDDAVIEDSLRTPKARSFGDQFKDVPDKSKLHAGRRKPTVGGSTGAARKRPSMRQRSSHSASTSTTLKASFPAAEGTQPRTGVEPKSNLSSMLKQQVPDLDTAADQETGRQNPVVQMSAGYERLSNPRDPTRSGSKDGPKTQSFTSGPSLLKKASTATAASVSYQATGTLDLKEPVQQDSECDTDRGSANDGILHSSRVHPQSDHEIGGSVQPLPRSRSQMAMLLQRGKR